MKKRNLLTLSILALLAGCDDGSSSSSDPCGGCPPDQTCEEGVCKNLQDVDPCSLCTGEQVCKDGKCTDPVDPCSQCTSGQICEEGVCKPGPNDPCAKCDSETENCVDDACVPKHSSEDPCSFCGEDQICVDKECKDKDSGDLCDPPCTDGKKCIEGQCATCVGNQCFFEQEDPDECENDEACPEGKRCHNGECIEIVEGECYPECVDGQICVEGKCENHTLLWSLCRSGSDCGVGECIFSVTPSRTTHLEVNGEIVEYTTDDPIPVSLLDSRINAENYNLTHSSQAGDDDDIGICSYECTKKADKICPSGWSCQLVAKGNLDYPDASSLPVPLAESDINESPFAALCRRDMTEDLQKDISYGVEFCNADESKCSEAGMVFYDGMCLEPCEESPDKCPYFFTCETVDTDSGSAKACVPNTGTCGSCYDRDGDGAGYGHCEKPGIDCDDDKSNTYYNKPLTCADIKDDSDNEIQTDLNCNGLIDKFELMGTLEHCSACGQACNKPQSGNNNITVTCEPVDSSKYDMDWRNSATMDAEPPAFACVEKCSFGWGDCKEDASCDVMLLKKEAQEAAAEAIKASKPVVITTSDVLVSNERGKIYALDNDKDGYPTIDVDLSVAPENRTLILDPFSSVVCCASGKEDSKRCYSADQDWVSLTLSSQTKKITNADGSKTNVDYVSKEVINSDGSKTVVQFASPQTSNSATSYDSNDKDKAINPKALEVCDGRDNDGSKLLSGETAPSCAEWCTVKDNEGKLIHNCDDFSTTSDNVTTYAVNPYCDATEDGSKDTKGWKDIAEGEDSKVYLFNDTCNMRHTNGEKCNEGTITCEEKPVISCKVGDENCSCKQDSHDYAYQITFNEDGTVNDEAPTNLNSPRYVTADEIVGGDVKSIHCRCDGSLCTEGDCTGKDSKNCFSACNHTCTIHAEHALACTTTNALNMLDGLKNVGSVDNVVYAIELNGIDDNCDGRVDEDAMVPCVISVSAPYSELAKGVEQPSDPNKPAPFITFVTAKDAGNYKYDSTDFPKNKDDSINLCQIGILQSRVKDGKLIPVCMPLFQPRDYDFYGDGFDSNCDGVDYDINHAVFVEKEAQGTWPGLDSNSCRYQTEKEKDPNDAQRHSSPCATLPRALEVANANHGEYSHGSFYDDILITGETFNIRSANNSGSQSYAIKIPALGQQQKVQKLFYYPTSDLKDESVKIGDKTVDLVKDHHIVHPYKMHALLVEAKRRKSTFDPNKYYFSYESLQTDKQLVDSQLVDIAEYKPVGYQCELPQPEEIIRIYGGFGRSSKVTQLPSEYDLWKRGDSKTTFNWIDFTPTKVMNSFIQPSSNNALSLRLNMMEINVTPKSPLSYSLVNGATFIGINAMSGAKRLNLSNFKMVITAPAGYSFDQSKAPEKNSPSAGHAGEDGDYYKGSGESTSYTKKMKSNSCQKEATCGSGRDGTVAQPRGGCGGHAWTIKKGGDKINGKGGYSSDNGKGGAGGKADGLGGGEDWYCPKGGRNKAQGNDGAGGAPGHNGDSQTTLKSMHFRIDKSTPYSIFVQSQRDHAKGEYGYPGGGGGGGAVYQCWRRDRSIYDDYRCYGSYGGNGGCGGVGGEAGGTGGSAIGIAVRSTSKTPGTVRILMDPNKNTMITTKNGSGGLSQPGAPGAAGGNGGWWYAFGECGGIHNSDCTDLYYFGMGGGGGGGGGGTGGDGGGGVAGWTYPFVFVCADPSVSDFGDDAKKMVNCGYELPGEFMHLTSTNGKQELSGDRYLDIPYDAKDDKKKGSAPKKLGITPHLSWNSDDEEGKNKNNPDDNKCGGTEKFRRPGGAGGGFKGISSQSSEKDTSCAKDGNIDVTVQLKGLKESDKNYNDYSF